MISSESNPQPVAARLIYRQLVAGCIPTVGADGEDAAARVAANALQDERIHMLASRSGDGTYFLAFPSRLATGGECFETPMAVALPTHPQHRGDGIYSFAGADVAIVKRAGELLSVPGDSAALESLAVEYRLPTHNVGPDVQPLALEPVYGRNRKAAERIARRVMHVSRVVLVASLVLYVVVEFSTGAARIVAERRATADAMAETVRRLQYVSPLAEQLAHLQIVFGTVVRAGGWINGYVWKRGEEAFDISLPGWVSHDYVDAMGPGATADFNIADNLVIVRKGDLEAVGKAQADSRQ